MYQQLGEGMNLVQMRLTWPLIAYMLDLNAPMNATPKLNNFVKKCIFSRGGHFIVKLNTTCETSLLPLYYMT
jgi:hypothetical protein